MAPETTDRPPTLVFDLDGTLVDTAEDLVAALNVVTASDGLPRVELADGRTMVGQGARAMIARAFAWHNRPVTQPDLDRLLAAFLAHYAEHMVDHSRLYPGVEETLSRFADAGWRLAVCTNKQEGVARQLLDLVHIADRFAAICGQDTFGFRKPDPRHLVETVKRAGGSPTRAVMVGDSLTDVDTAIAAAIPVVAVTFGYSAVPMTDVGASRVVAGYAELWDAVAGLALDARPLAPARG